MIDFGLKFLLMTSLFNNIDIAILGFLAAEVLGRVALFHPLRGYWIQMMVILGVIIFETILFIWFHFLIGLSVKVISNSGNSIVFCVIWHYKQLKRLEKPLMCSLSFYLFFLIQKEIKFYSWAMLFATTCSKMK